jgi:hypothetical protein
MPARRRFRAAQQSAPWTAARRTRREARSQRDRALQAWLTSVLAGDQTAAHLVWWVGTLHAGVMAWMGEAIDAGVRPPPGTASVSGSPDPDRAMLRALAPNLEAGDLEKVRKQVSGKLDELAGWYHGQLNATGVAEPWADLELVGNLAAWTRDPELAPQLERCLRQHATLKHTGEMGRRHAAVQRWRRLATWYIRLLDGKSTTLDLR